MVVVLPSLARGFFCAPSTKKRRQHFALIAPHPDSVASALRPLSVWQCKRATRSTSRNDHACLATIPICTVLLARALRFAVRHGRARRYAGQRRAAPARSGRPHAKPGQPGYRRGIPRQRAGRRGAGAPAVPQHRQGLARGRLPAAAAHRRGGVLDGTGHRRAPHRGRHQAEGSGAQGVRAGPHRGAQGRVDRGGQRQPVPHRCHQRGTGRGSDDRAALLAADRLPGRRILAALPAHLHPALPHASRRAARRYRHRRAAGVCR